MCNLLSFAFVQSDYDIAGIDQRPRELSQQICPLATHDGIRHDEQRPDKTDYPKTDRQHRFVSVARIEPLIDESDRKDRLPRDAVNKEPNGNPRIGKKACLCLVPTEYEQPNACRNRQAKEYDPQQPMHLLPRAFGLEIPDVNIVGDRLSENDDEIVAEPAIYAEQERCNHTHLPKDDRRNNFAGAFRHHPLHNHPTRKQSLSQQTYRLDSQPFHCASYWSRLLSPIV